MIGERTIFDSNGEPSLILHENGRLVSFNGQNIGFCDEDSVYDYGGGHRGWFENGVLRDHDGYCIGFLRGARDTSSPVFPVPQVPPVPEIPQIEPIRPVKEIKPIKPVKQMVWSSFDPISVFMA